jgi:hypothetical protein
MTKYTLHHNGDGMFLCPENPTLNVVRYDKPVLQRALANGKKWRATWLGFMGFRYQATADTLKELGQAMGCTLVACGPTPSMRKRNAEWAAKEWPEKE